MQLKPLWAGLIVCIALFLPNTANALSCARPVLNEAAINAAVMIFEGRVGAKRRLGARETVVVKTTTIKGRGGSIENLRVYRFSVTRGWKGATAGQKVDVLFNTAWGDGFAKGVTYLVVSPQRAGKLYFAPLCGHTVDLAHAVETGGVAALERVIGIGHHLKVKQPERVCRRDDDCTSVQTHCGACSCGTPIAKQMAKHFKERFDKLCATIRIADRCEMNCPPRELTCRSGYCLAKK